MIDISIVIPTYNRELLLEKTLNSLSQQEAEGIEYEVIVSDDGSEDETFNVVNLYKKRINIKYVYNKHEGYRVGYVRNRGVEIAEGRTIIFVDSGMLLDKKFIRYHYNAHLKKNVAVIGSVYGLPATLSDTVFSEYIRTEDLDKVFQLVCDDEKYNDLRENCLRYYNNSMENMIAPYSFFWTGNVSVDKNTFINVGGFDENITGWGMEDIELGYRLFRLGVRFVYVQEAKGIHLPHDITEQPNNSWTGEKDFENKLYFYKKYRNLDAEIYLSCNDCNYNLLLTRLFERSNSRIDFKKYGLAEGMKEYIGNDTVIMGAFNGGMVPSDCTPTLVEYDGKLCDELHRLFGNKMEIEHFVGIHTEFYNKQFSICLILDYCWLLDEVSIRHLIMESLRISERVLLFYRFKDDISNILLEMNENQLLDIMSYLKMNKLDVNIIDQFYNGCTLSFVAYS